MRGADQRTGAMFSYVSLEARVPATHPLRAVRHITDRALERISPQLGTLYVNWRRPCVAPRSCGEHCCCKRSTPFGASAS